MRPVLAILTLAGLVGLNVQFYFLYQRLDAAPERLADHLSGLVVAQSQPEAIQKKLDELERLRASNAALQAVVASLSSSPSVGAERPSSGAGGGRSDISADFSFFPVLPLPGSNASPPKVVATAPQSADGADAESDGEDSEEDAKGAASAPSAGRLLVTPIRTRDNGALVYLALDKVVRIVEVNGRLHGVDGYYEGVDGDVVNLNIKGRRISLPLLVSGT